MKSYTDLEQSKRLAEFLPIKSADMLIGNYVGKSGIVDGTNIHYYTKGETFGAPQIIEAWSLAALLDVLPDEISTGEGYQNKYEIDIRRYYGGNNITLYQIAYGNNKGSSGSWHDIISTSEQEKFVDVCYEMIIKLHEQKLL